MSVDSGRPDLTWPQPWQQCPAASRGSVLGHGTRCRAGSSLLGPLWPRVLSKGRLGPNAVASVMCQQR